MTEKLNIDLHAEEKGTHVSASVYMHPESMTALVKELYEHWQHERFNHSAMYFYSGLLTADPAAYIELHNLDFGTAYVFDSERASELCFDMLNDCRKARGYHAFGRG